MAQPAPPQQPAVDGPEAALREAARLHRAGEADAAIHAYRAILSKGVNAHAAVLLANLLIEGRHDGAAAAASGLGIELVPGLAATLRRAEASVMAKMALDAVAGLPDKEAAKVYARHGYFLLQYHGAIPGGVGAPSGGDSDSDDEGEGSRGKAAPAPSERSAGIAAAAASLEAATRLAPQVALSWRHLATAYTALRRFAEAEAAAAAAVRVAGGPAAPWELHYRHAKALKRLGDAPGAALKYCDALEADGQPGAGTSDVALYWLRITAGSPAFAGFPAAAAERVTATLAKHAERAAAAPAVPHDYIRKLFDGYSKHFDEHLTQRLGYATPRALLTLALQQAAAAAPGAAAGPPMWDACADLGCGTGLAGVEFRRYVRRLAGCDLSAGMVAEARARPGVYDALAVAEVEAWLAGQPEACYDLVVCADVLVYIGALEGVFAGVARVMRRSGPAGGPHPPSLFVVSTEAELAPQPAPTGFRLTPTGRCVHARQYVLGLAAAHGFVARNVAQQPIRRNAGADVIGDLYVLEYEGGPAGAGGGSSSSAGAADDGVGGGAAAP